MSGRRSSLLIRPFVAASMRAATTGPTLPIDIALRRYPSVTPTNDRNRPRSAADKELKYERSLSMREDYR